MNFEEFAKSRKSTRGFLDKPISKKLINEIINAAKWAPSSYNTQTWHIHAVAGDVLNKIREGNIEETMAGKPHVRDFPYKEEYEGVHRQNQIDVAIQLFEAMGIERDDKEKRMDWMLRGFRQFDAPVAIIVTFDEELKEDDISKFDCGAAVNGLVNAGWSKGLGAVINSQGIMQSPVVREYAKIPDNQIIMICVAMGYPDEEFPANKVISKRRPIEEVATFHGF